MKSRLQTAMGGRAAAAWMALAVAAPAGADWPPWGERWLVNPVERTERALDRAREGTGDDAVEPLETALRLAGDHPVALYNAGTARLASGREDARPLLEAAAAGEARRLAGRANYNLGNARMAGGDLEGAIAAFEQALRHEPGLGDAKFNLELARRLLEEQEQEQEQQDRQEPQEAKERQQEEQRQEQEQQQQQEKQPQQDPRQQPQDAPQPPRQQESPLPQFENLPDMTAQEAAAILEAVENLEREQRRRDALEAAGKNARGKKDW